MAGPWASTPQSQPRDEMNRTWNPTRNEFPLPRTCSLRKKGQTESLKDVTVQMLCPFQPSCWVVAPPLGVQAQSGRSMAVPSNPSTSRMGAWPCGVLLGVVGSCGEARAPSHHRHPPPTTPRLLTVMESSLPHWKSSRPISSYCSWTARCAYGQTWQKPV